MAVAYYLGGKLSHFFGITTPDWQYAIDIHEDMEREAREEREEEERALQHLEESVTRRAVGYMTAVNDCLLSYLQEKTKAFKIARESRKCSEGLNFHVYFNP